MQCSLEPHTFQVLFENLANPVLLFDAANQVKKLNVAALELFPGPPQPEGRPDPEGAARRALLWLGEELARFTAADHPDATFEKAISAAAGPRVFTVRLKRLLGPDQRILGTVAMLCDVTAYRQAEEKVRQFSRVAEQNPCSIVITDPAGNIEYVNPKFSRATGYSEAEVLGKNPRLLKSGEKPPEEYRQLWEAIAAGQEWRGEFHNRRKDGELYWESASISPVRNAEGVITHYLAVKEDITARKQAETERERLIAELQQALAKVKTLSGLVPICASCKKIRDDKGFWNQLESYIQQHSEAQFSHGICPDCLKKLYPDFAARLPS